MCQCGQNSFSKNFSSINKKKVIKETMKIKTRHLCMTAPYWSKIILYFDLVHFQRTPN